MGIYKKILSEFSVSLFLLFIFSIYKMVDSMDTYKSLKVNIGTVMRNPEILKFVPDHLKLNRRVIM